MLIINIGFVNDTVDKTYHAVGLKLSYFLCNQLRMAGDLANMFNMREPLMKMDSLHKIKFALHHDHNMTEEDKQPMRSLGKKLKEGYKIKRKTKEQIVLIKKTERLIEDYFLDVLEGYMKHVNSMDISRLSDLNENLRVRFYEVETSGSEEPKNKDKSPFSDVLLLNLPEDELAEPIVMFLNDKLFGSSFQEAYPGTLPPENEKTDAGFITTLLHFYNFNFMTVNSIDAIRNHVKNSLVDFQQSFDRFINLRSEPAAAFNYLQNELKHAAAYLQNEIDKSAMIKGFMHDPRFTGAEVEVVAGMLPWDTIYKYFMSVNALKGEAAAVIEKAPLTGLMPVLIMKTNVEDKTGQSLIQPASIENNIATPLKKSLVLE